tara:strand:- start:292 stop:423 length:132 start_codon:yes stop_codon:yes gene_type:complete
MDLVYLVGGLLNYPFHEPRIGAGKIVVDGASDLLSGGQVHDLD